jgi:beta-ketoacyl ACP synthase
MTAVSACASGSEAIAHAWRNIVLGEADIAICGGVETKIEAVPIAAFAQMRIVLSTNNDDPAGACRPFDRDRNGFVFGEGGALMLIETEEHAKARGANILARLMGASITSDGYHIVAPDPNGEQAGRDDACDSARGARSDRHRPHQRACHRHRRRRRGRREGHQQRDARPQAGGLRP